MLRYEKNLAEHKSAQCHILLDDLASPNHIQFWSYTTMVVDAIKEDGTWKFNMTGHYSSTTSKQVTWFLREYFPGVSRTDLEVTIGTDNYVEV